jgi:hypothetical protein
MERRLRSPFITERVSKVHSPFNNDELMKRHLVLPKDQRAIIRLELEKGHGEECVAHSEGARS